MNEMEILDVPAFAELLGMTEQSLYARRSRDPESLPPAIRIGRRLVWRRETIEEWLVDLERTQNRSRRRQTPAAI
jgi:predicted DNA-binding transcriptional regulator AlpA